MEDLRIRLTEVHRREQLIDDLLETICDNPDVRSLETQSYDNTWLGNLGMIANSEVFAVLLTLKYPGIDIRL